MTATTETGRATRPHRSRRVPRTPRREPSRFPIYLVVGVVALLWTIPIARPARSTPSGSRARSGAADGGRCSARSSIRPRGPSRTTPIVLERASATPSPTRLAVTIPSVVIPITIAAFAAYAFAWMDFPGRNLLFVFVVGLMVVPLQMALIPILRIYTDFDLTGTYPGRVAGPRRIRPPAGDVPVAQLHGLAAVVHDRVGQDRRRRPLHDLHPARRAALGAGAGVVRHLPVPVDVERLPGGACLPRLRAPNRVLTVELADLAGRGEGALNLLPAAAFVTMILPLVVFFALQRFFVRGLTAGSVKG